MSQINSSPLWSVNRAFVAIEAMDLAVRASERERARQAARPTAQPEATAHRTRRTWHAAATLVAVIVSGLAFAAWMA